MRPSRHLALSTAAGGATWAITGEPWALPVTLGAGVLVDVDHTPDIWWTLALRRKPLATFLFHAWEWLAGLLALGIWIGFPWWLVAVLVGFGSHIITDHLFNHAVPWCYSLIYRASQGFQMARLAPDWDIEDTEVVLGKEIPPAAWLIDWWRNRSAPRSCKNGGTADALQGHQHTKLVGDPPRR